MAGGLIATIVGLAVLIGVYMFDFALIPGGPIANYVLLIVGGGAIRLGISLIRKARGE